MNNAVKLILKIIVAIWIIVFVLGLGLYWDFHNYQKHSVPVLAYHRVLDADDIYSMPPDEFDQQMAYLKEQGYTTISLENFVQKCKTGDEKQFSKNIVITFDDGYDDNNKNAMPIMKKYGYTGTIFVAVKYMAWPGYVNWQDLRSLQKAGWEIGSHTFNHVELAKCSKETTEKEIGESRAFLEGFIKNQFKINTLAYPFGSYNDKVFEALAKNSYVAAVTGRDGVNVVTSNPYELYRVNIFHDKLGLKGFKKRLLRAQAFSWLRSWGIEPTSFLARIS